MRRTRRKMKQSRDNNSVLGESSLEGYMAKCKTETVIACEMEGRFRTCADNEASINTLGALFPLGELFDVVGFSDDGNGEPDILLDNPDVQQVERLSRDHEPAQIHDNMHPLQDAMGPNNDTYIEPSALRDEILVAYKHNHDLRQTVQQQDPEKLMKNEYGNDSFISKATNVDLSQEEMESAKACLRLTLKTWILPQSEHHVLGSCASLETQNASKHCSPVLIGNDLPTTIRIDQPQEQPISPLLESNPPFYEWDGDNTLSGHLSREPDHLDSNHEDNLPSHPFCTSSSLLLDSYTTILDDDFLSLFDPSAMKNPLLLD